jgi:porin
MKVKRQLIVAALALFSATARAGAPQPFSPELYLDWHDLRELLSQEGIDFRIGYVSETASNLQGGDEQLWRYTDQWTFWTRLDLQKLLNLRDAQFNVIITDRNGRNLSSDAQLDSLQQVQELYGRGQTWRWTEFWYGQQYFKGHLDWKVGRMPVGDDFAAFSCEFMNLTFCGSGPGNVVGGYWYNWPVSQWATRIKATSEGLGYLEVGAYAVNPSWLLTRNALKLGNPSGTTGVLAPLELAWLPTFRGLGGSYKVGGWYSSTTAPDVVDNTAEEPLVIDGGAPLMRHGQYGAYVNFEQRLTAPDGIGSARGLSLFFNATYADRRTSTLDSQVAVGILYTGPLAARPQDELGVAAGETHVNSRVAAVERLQNEEGYGPVPVQSSEWVGEVFYNLHMAGWLDLRPNVQYVADPGGVAGRINDVIFGMRVAMNF